METQQKVFVRKASGLVREVSPWDAWIFNAMTMGWIAAISYTLLTNPGIFPGGNQTLAILMTAILGTFMWITYVFICTAMPRSGVDWVAQSRFLTPWIAAPIVVGDFFYLIYWDVFGYFMANTMGIQPFAAVLGAATNNNGLTQLAAWLATSKGIFIVGMIYLLLMGWQLVLPIRIYAKIQKYLVMLFAVISTSILVVLFALTPNANFVNNVNQFALQLGGGSDFYHTVITNGAAIKDLHPAFNWYDTVGMMALLWSLLSWAFWSGQLSGEIKSADKVKTQAFIMIGSGWTTAIVWILAWIAISSSVGTDFITAAGALYLNGQWTLPLAPFANFYAGAALMAPGFGFLCLFIMLIFAVAMMFAGYHIYYNTMVGPVRMFFAMAFDRALPDFFSKVHHRWHTPVNLVMLSVVCAAIQIYLSSYMPTVAPVFLPAALGSGCIPFIFTSMAGALMPFTGKGIYDASPAAKYKIGRIPLVTITGIVSVVFNVVLTYFWLTVPALGINPGSLVFVIGAYVVGIVYYVIWRTHRKRQGVNLDLAFKVIPPD